jgi:signal transduction histidine kinase
MPDLEHERLEALLEAAERRRDTAERLAELGQLMSRCLDLSRVGQYAVDSLRALIPSLRAALYRGNPISDEMHLVAHANDPGITIVSQVVFPHATGMPGLAASERCLVVTENLLADPRVRLTPELRAYWASTPIRAVAAVPLLAGNGIVGVLVVSDVEGRVFTDEELRILEMFAAQVTVALENARLYARLEDKTHRLEVLHRLAVGLTATLGRQEVFTAVAGAALELFGDVGCSLWVLEPDGTTLRLVADEGIRFPDLRKARRLSVGQGLMGTVVAERRPIVLDDVQEGGHNQALSRAEGFRTAMAVPLLFGERCFGGISVRRRSLEPFGAEDVDLLTALAGHAAITIEQSRLYDDITRTNDDLRAKNTELDSFAFAVSHDLKAPLVTLEGMAGLLVEECGEKIGDEGRHYVTRILATVEQMNRLVRDVLMLARVGRESHPTERVSLDELVAEILDRTQDALKAKGATVSCQRLGEVRAVPTQMDQVFSNLISNAVKYSGASAAPVVEVGRSERDGTVEYYVRDNGIGIDPAYHAKVFEAFQRLKEVEAEGTGVGLAIVKKIVEGAGGRLRLESAVGAGATFFFTWPPDGGAPPPAR